MEPELSRSHLTKPPALSRPRARRKIVSVPGGVRLVRNWLARFALGRETRSETLMLTSKMLTLLLAACIVGMCAPVLSQAGAGGSGSGGSGTGGTAASTSAAGTGASNATVGTSPTAGTGGLKGTVGTAPSGGIEDPTTTVGATSTAPDTDQGAQHTHSKARPGSAAALQAQRNAGAGTAPNGLPIGVSGSGPGSPEQPINSGRE